MALEKGDACLLARNDCTNLLETMQELRQRDAVEQLCPLRGFGVQDGGDVGAHPAEGALVGAQPCGEWWLCGLGCGIAVVRSTADELGYHPAVREQRGRGEVPP